MRGSMAARRGAAWAVAAVLVILAASFLLTPGGVRSAGDIRSSRRATPDGLIGIRGALEALDRKTAEVASPLLDPAKIPARLVLIEPRLPPSPREAEHIVDAVKAGGTLLYAFRSPEATTPLTRLLGLELVESSPQSEPAWTEHELARGLDPPKPRFGFVDRGIEISEPDSARDLVRSAGQRPPDLEFRPLLLAGEAPLAAEVKLERGRIVLFADGSAFSNAKAGEDPQAVLGLRALLEDSSPGDTIYFGEYFQGIRGQGSQAEILATFLVSHPIGRLFLQLGAACALALIVLGTRVGGVRPGPRRLTLERRSPLEHARALAGLYRRAEADEVAALRLLARPARTHGLRVPDRVSGMNPVLKQLEMKSNKPLIINRMRNALRRKPIDLPQLASAVDALLRRGHRN